MEYPYVKGVSEKFGITSITKQTDIPRVSYIDYDLFYIYLADAMAAYYSTCLTFQDDGSYDIN